jgi:hypothetical protein
MYNCKKFASKMTKSKQKGTMPKTLPETKMWHSLDAKTKATAK